MRDTVWFQNQKYLLSNPLQEKFADPWHNLSCSLNSSIQGYLLSPHSVQELYLPKLHLPLPSIAWSPGSPSALLTGLSDLFLYLSLFFPSRLNANVSLGFLISTLFWAKLSPWYNKLLNLISHTDPSLEANTQLHSYLSREICKHFRLSTSKMEPVPSRSMLPCDML